MVFAGLDAQADADDGEPHVVLPHHHHGPAIECNGGKFVRRARQFESDHAARHRRDARRDEGVGAQGRSRTPSREQRDPRKIVSHRHP